MGTLSVVRLTSIVEFVAYQAQLSVVESTPDPDDPAWPPNNVQALVDRLLEHLPDLSPTERDIFNCFLSRLGSSSGYFFLAEVGRAKLEDLDLLSYREYQDFPGIQPS